MEHGAAPGSSGPVAPDEGGPGRSIGLTDGVVAIALTLLALDLRPNLPGSASSHQLAHYLNTHAAQYGAFALAFVLVAQYWLVHHHLMRDVVRTSAGLLRLTMLFLFGITVVPLTSYMVGEFSNSLATVLFAANIALISTSLSAMGWLIRRSNLDDHVESRDDRLTRSARAVATIAIPVLVALLAWPLGARASYFYLLFLAADVPGRVLARRLR